MNIIEVIKRRNVGKIYEIFIDGTSKGRWELKDGFSTKEFDFFKDGEALTEIYFASQIARMEFEEVIDWSKVPIDAKVLISSDGIKWERRHFAKYENEKVYCFIEGLTSFTTKDNKTCVWKYVRLYQE